jgi:hypothetical protein
MYHGGIKMAKWKSPFLSDIRNKLGDSVVFSSWKGRQYMRSYVEPANPNTSAQQAFRESMSEAVNRWQAHYEGTPAEDAWNEYATPEQLTGFNLFTRYFQGSDVEITNTPTSGGNVEVDYETNVPLDRAAVAIMPSDISGEAEDMTSVNSESGSATLTAPSSSGDYVVLAVYEDVDEIMTAGELGTTDVHRDPDSGTAERQTFSI